MHQINSNNTKPPTHSTSVDLDTELFPCPVEMLWTSVGPTSAAGSAYCRLSLAMAQQLPAKFKHALNIERLRMWIELIGSNWHLYICIQVLSSYLNLYQAVSLLYLLEPLRALKLVSEWQSTRQMTRTGIGSGFPVISIPSAPDLLLVHLRRTSTVLVCPLPHSGGGVGVHDDLSHVGRSSRCYWLLCHGAAIDLQQAPAPQLSWTSWAIEYDSNRFNMIEDIQTLLNDFCSANLRLHCEFDIVCLIGGQEL
jgi:hypothetical protein